MDFEPMDNAERDDVQPDSFERDQFERDLQQAFLRRPAPPSLKRKLMERRSRQHTERIRHRMAIWERLAAGLVIAAALGGGFAWHQHQQDEEQRKGEAARQQVFTALRITSRALNQVKAQLAEHDHDRQE